MPRLAEAEKKLHDAIAALESALLAIPESPAVPAASAAPTAPVTDNSAIVAEMQDIDRKIEQAMALVAKAQKNGAAVGEAE